MATIHEYLGNDHDHCDKMFVNSENSVSQEAWADAYVAWRTFHNALEKHFTREEKVLFVAIKAAGDGCDGPVNVMRLEHRHIRDMVIDLDHAISRRDRIGYLNMSDTLLVLMQQHNAKEENILYPLCDRVLQSSCDDLIIEMQSLATELPNDTPIPRVNIPGK